MPKREKETRYWYDDFKGKPAVFNMGGGPEHTTSLLEFLDLLAEKTDKLTDLTFDDWR